MLNIFSSSPPLFHLKNPKIVLHRLPVLANTNGATYKIKVGLPADYNSSTKKHAAIYVLDGEENFEFVSNKCKEISDKLAVTNDGC